MLASRVFPLENIELMIKLRQYKENNRKVGQVKKFNWPKYFIKIFFKVTFRLCYFYIIYCESFLFEVVYCEFRINKSLVNFPMSDTKTRALKLT